MLILKTWNKATIALLKRARNTQTITEVLVYNHTRTCKMPPKVKRTQFGIPEPYGPIFVQTTLYAHTDSITNAPPTDYLKLNTTQ